MFGCPRRSKSFPGRDPPHCTTVIPGRGLFDSTTGFPPREPPDSTTVILGRGLRSRPGTAWKDRATTLGNLSVANVYYQIVTFG